jgi:predicted regulator of Ras-like GTPase activity (Roadblock/LC7/MglB family)
MGATTGGTDPGQALATLTELSSQIEGAVIMDEKGAVLGSSFASEEAGTRVAAAATALLRAARERAGEERAPLTHLLVETDDGAVFVVREDGKTAAAVTGREPTAGLVFYDLKVTLREAKARPKRRSTAKREPAGSAKATEKEKEKEKEGA